MAEKSKFDTESTAQHYASARPTYPAALFDTLDDLLAHRLSAADVVDVAAGTGISSRQLAERGAHVVAVELSTAMLAQLAASSPGVRAVQGSGHALPLADSSADLITYAQAWHWMDPARALPEIRRVLRPGGVLALWWNQTDRSAGWAREQAERISAAVPGWVQESGVETAEQAEMDTTTPKHSFRFEWTRTVTVETHLANLASKSYIAGLGDGGEAFIAGERQILGARLPAGEVVERFSTLLVATLPRDTLSIAQI
ncbi:MAG TPA: class I SAM-dependent methyltransferase [Actinospica sp.]|nr:class I SAM-dependent methyltransferase [Actinospica sp.]